MQRCVVIAGAEINDYAYLKSRLLEDDYIICCDSGLKHCSALGVMPNLIVGDFDSHENPRLPVETIVLPCEKDDTDTFFAVKEAIRRGFENFLLLGVIGGRLDHSLGNISALVYLDSLGKTALAIDDYSEMEIISQKTACIPDSFPYFSVINISGTAKDITIKNAKYPLEKSQITWEYQFGVSNEVLPGKTAEVSLGEGRLLVIKVRKA